MEPNYSLFQTRKERGLRCNQIACSIVHHHSWQRQAGASAAQRRRERRQVEWKRGGGIAATCGQCGLGRGVKARRKDLEQANSPRHATVPAEAQSHADFPYPSVNR
ncbi:hypothetical protein JZ751_000027 [Albula glossodonta]|uniref:Uncharacterized protein n=1 Tax=Albula glossodonta TaxID=121402 RepID=A0A8T2PV02_9TELE|nr:hypothetical protein JZ751_000027 [Albula glossodonta]